MMDVHPYIPYSCNMIHIQKSEAFISLASSIIVTVWSSSYRFGMMMLELYISDIARVGSVT